MKWLESKFRARFIPPSVIGLTIRLALVSAISLVLSPTCALGKLKAGSEATHAAGQVRLGNVHIAKGETVDGDLTAAGSIEVEGTVTGDCIAKGGPAKVSGKVLGDLVLLGGPGSVSGEIGKDVTSLGGPLNINGKVKGDVTSLGGPVALGPSAWIGGGLTHLGGPLSQAEGATILGKVTRIDLGSMGNLLSLAAKYGGNCDFSDSKSACPLSAFNWVLLAVIGATGVIVLLLAALLSKATGNMAEAIEFDFWKSAGIGLLIYVLLAPALIFLCISIVGILFIPLVLLLFCVAEILSFAAFSQALARRFFETLKKGTPSHLAATAVGYLLLNLLLILGAVLAPAGSVGGIMGGMFLFVGFILVSCALMVGIGAAWITRMGSRGQ